MPKASTTTQKQAQPATQAGPACTRVFVVDRNGRPLMPCAPKRARLLLRSKRADVFRMNPFTIRILDREGGDLQPMEVKIDPGSKTTGLAVMVKGSVRGWFCVAAFELNHRGQKIRKALLSRAQLRRGRRSRKTRYRQPRFNNRTRPDGWLPPSLRSRVDNTLAHVRRVARIAPVSALQVELARFDTQLMENPEISGVGYQQGTLAGYEVREYLLEKWDRACAYCQAKDVPLQIDHIQPRSKGGSDRVSNLCLACGKCNQKKGNLEVEEFLEAKPGLLARILRQARAPLKDAAAMNATRLALVRELRAQAPHIPVATATGGRTKFNRSAQNYPKTHWIDAACVGATGVQVDLSQVKQITVIHAKGRGSRQMCKPDDCGFPRTSAKTVKRLHGFQTGDRVRLQQPKGKYKGLHEGVVSIRATGKFDIKTLAGARITAPHSRFTLLSRFDGYTYERKRAG